MSQYCIWQTEVYSNNACVCSDLPVFSVGDTKDIFSSLIIRFIFVCLLGYYGDKCFEITQREAD